MRVISSLLLFSILAAGCAEEPEPLTDPRARMRPYAPDEASGEEGVAHAQQRPPHGDRAATPTAPPPSAVETVPGDQRAPDRFTVRLETTKGPILIDVHRAWAPHGADRFYTLVREGFFTDVAFFRVIEGFMAQGGLSGDPAVNTRWRNRRIPDDTPRESNRRGMVSFAMGGPGTRTTQFFINLVDNTRLDGMGFAPFGRVRDMATVDRLHAGYGEGAPRGRGPIQGRMQSEGNAYLRAEFPELDSIRGARIVSPASPTSGPR